MPFSIQLRSAACPPRSPCAYVHPLSPSTRAGDRSVLRSPTVRPSDQGYARVHSFSGFQFSVVPAAMPTAGSTLPVPPSSGLSTYNSVCSTARPLHALCASSIACQSVHIFHCPLRYRLLAAAAYRPASPISFIMFLLLVRRPSDTAIGSALAAPPRLCGQACCFKAVVPDPPEFFRLAAFHPFPGVLHCSSAPQLTFVLPAARLSASFFFSTICGRYFVLCLTVAHFRLAVARSTWSLCCHAVCDVIFPQYLPGLCFRSGRRSRPQYYSA